MDSFKLDDNLYQKYEYAKDGELDNNRSEFDGDWKRTKTHRAINGCVDILRQTEEYIFFTATLGAGGHGGTISGVARIYSNNEAIYLHNSSLNQADLDLTYIKFSVVDGLLKIESNNNDNLGFGMNVTIDGEYTQGTPAYTNEDIIKDTFGTSDRINEMKDFLGEKSWSFLKSVMEYGYIHPAETLTYSGFISGLGEGADFLMTEDSKIYYLSYGEGPTNIFYTNDEEYRNLVPEFLLEKVRAFDNMQFVYKGEDEEVITNEYVWVRGHYTEPEALQYSDTIKWDREGASEWIEVIVKGAIENLSLVSLIQNEEDGSLEMDEILFRVDHVENRRVVIKANQPEGIPYEAIRFEDVNGKVDYYYIQENSQSGEPDALNENIFRLDGDT